MIISKGASKPLRTSTLDRGQPAAVCDFYLYPWLPPREQCEMQRDQWEATTRPPTSHTKRKRSSSAATSARPAQRCQQAMQRCARGPRDARRSRRRSREYGGMRGLRADGVCPGCTWRDTQERSQACLPLQATITTTFQSCSLNYYFFFI